MALIERHPLVADTIHSLSLADIAGRGGIADLLEQGQLVVIKDYRLEFEAGLLDRLARSTEGVDDPVIKRKLKKLEASYFFAGEPPVERNGRLTFDNRIRQAVFDVLCHGDAALFRRTEVELRRAHDEMQRIFAIAFPDYDPFRLVASVRLTRTLFENLHWDEHSIDEDFHQTRIFANLDKRPRIWHVSHGFPDMVRRLYVEHDLGRFAGQDPNLMIRYINSTLLGGLHRKWLDKLPRHRLAFDPGEVWIGESRLVSHQIYYGESAMAYMWFIRPESMANPDRRFNAQVEALHQEMAVISAKASIAV